MMNLRLPDPPLAIAHRGGAGLPANEGNENSLNAVRNAVQLGYHYIETDVQTTRDGVAFVLHDADLTRVTGRPDQVGDLTAADLRTVTLNGGGSISTLGELLEEFPTLRFNIDLKSDAVVDPAVRALRAGAAVGRVVLAAFSHRRLQRVRRLLPNVATSASPLEVAALRIGRVPLAARNGAVALQVPVSASVGGKEMTVLTDSFIRPAHARGLQVHVWTIDDAAAMHELLDRGVDGIVADRIDVLRDVLIERDQWPGRPWPSPSACSPR